MRIKGLLARALLTLLLASRLGCAVEDEDRCLSGYEWDPDILSCRELVEDIGDENTDDGDTGGESTSDGGADAGDVAPTGMGVTCTASGNECDSFEADFCLYNPIEPDEPGICTIENCEGDDCPTGYQCCNLIINIACLPDASVADALEKGGQCPPQE